jgi:hypothetical protein
MPPSIRQASRGVGEVRRTREQIMFTDFLHNTRLEITVISEVIIDIEVVHIEILSYFSK